MHRVNAFLCIFFADILARKENFLLIRSRSMLFSCENKSVCLEYKLVSSVNRFTCLYFSSMAIVLINIEMNYFNFNFRSSHYRIISSNCFTHWRFHFSVDHVLLLRLFADCLHNLDCW